MTLMEINWLERVWWFWKEWSDPVAWLGLWRGKIFWTLDIFIFGPILKKIR